MGKYISISILGLFLLLTLVSVHAIAIPSSYQQKVSTFLSAPEAQAFFNSLTDDQKNVMHYLTKKELKACFENTTRCLDTVRTFKLEATTKEGKFKKRVLTYDILSSEEERIPLITKRLEDLQDAYADAKEEFIDAKQELKDCEEDGDKCPQENEEALETGKIFLSVIIDIAVERLNIVNNKITLSTELTPAEFENAHTDLSNAIKTLAQLKGQISLALTKKDAKEYTSALKTTLSDIDHKQGLYVGLVVHAKSRNILERAIDLEEKLDCTIAGAADTGALVKDKADSFSQLIGEVKGKTDVTHELIDRILSLKQNATDVEKREISGLILSLNEVLDESRSALQSAHKLSIEIITLLKESEVALKSCKTEEYILVKAAAPVVVPKPSDEKIVPPVKEPADAQVPEPKQNTTEDTDRADIKALAIQTAKRQIENYYARLQYLQQLRRQKIGSGQKVDTSVDFALESTSYNLAVANALLDNGDIDGAKLKIEVVKGHLDKAEKTMTGQIASVAVSNVVRRNTTTLSSSRRNTSAEDLDTKDGLLDAIHAARRKIQNDLDTLDDLDRDIDAVDRDKDTLQETHSTLSSEANNLRSGLSLVEVRVNNLKETNDDFEDKLAYEKGRYLSFKTRLTKLESDIETLQDEVEDAR